VIFFFQVLLIIRCYNKKPLILDIYEHHFIPLGQSLIPALSGIIISLLPGLEEESSEFYERSGRLMDGICNATSPILFYRALWKSISTTPHIRTPGLAYLLSHIPSNHLDPSLYITIFKFFFQ
jgi:hypothetical protein